MRILLIHNFYQYWGGEDTYVTSLKKLLEENGHEVYLYSKDSKNIKRVLDKMKIAIGLFYNPWVKKELTKIIKEFKPDIAHFHNVYPLIGATAYRICKQNNIRIIQHIHNYRFMCPKGILFRKGKICELCLHKKFPYYLVLFGCYHQSRLASLFFSSAFYYHNFIGTFDLINKYIFPSEFTRDYYLKHFKISKNKTYYLPYFVDIKKTDFKKEKKENYFLYVGRLSEEKGIVQLLDVFKMLPKIKLMVIGDGPLRQEVNKYKKYPNIKILGFLKKEKIYKYIRKSRAVIIPSLWYEVLPIIYIEAIKSQSNILILSNRNFEKIAISDQRYLHNTFLFKDFFELKEKFFYFYRKSSGLIKSFNQGGWKSKYSSKTHFISILRQYKRSIFY